MHRIVPELIIENYRAGRLRGTFEAASMFLDISGFSAMTDVMMGQGRNGAEALAVMMGAVFDPLVEAVFDQGGFVAGYAGDSISAHFPELAGEPRAALRALACANAIQHELVERPSFETPYGAFRISARIGLAEGSVSWGILRSRSGENAVYYFRGDAVEGATRAERAAGSGDIVLTEQFSKRLGSVVETKPWSDFRLLEGVPGALPASHPVALGPIDANVAGIFAPPDIITQDLKGEFRQTVHVFLGIPEVPDEVLGGFLDTIFELQTQYGGLIDRVDFGDKGCNVRVLWGAPIAYENDIERALEFALSLQKHCTVPLRIGVTYYISHAGYIGARLYENYTCYGWGLNLAARFMMEAPENDIWVDERVYQRVGARFRLDYVDEHTFKGFVQKQKVYALRGRKSQSAAVFRGRMAGREVELQRLAEFLGPIWDRKFAGVLAIWGEAGIGKSRLVFEFQNSAALADRSFLWAFCQADEVLRRPFHPFRHWLLRYFDIAPEQDPGTRLQNFRRKMDDVLGASPAPAPGSDLQRLRPFLAALVEVNWPDAAYEQTDAQGRYDNTILALITLLKAEAARQPVILSVEDAHFLDEDSRTCLVQLRRSLAADPIPLPLAIIMTARRRGTRVLLEDDLVDRQLDLDALPDEAISSIAQDVLGRPLDTALARLVNERSAGNPFFAEQVVRLLQERDLLERSPAGSWQLKDAAAGALPPADISALLVARLDRLSRHVKDVVQAAAVLGRAFDPALLAAMLPSHSQLKSDIAAAEHAGIWSALGERRYIFDHSLLRDVAYNMQLQSRRRELHARAFAAMRDRYRDDPERHYGELAYHSEQAALADDAIRYLRLAGDGARDQYQNALALDFYHRALALTPREDISGRYRLHRECEGLLADQGRLDERRSEIEQLQEIADNEHDLGNLAEVCLLRSRLANALGEYQQSVDLAQEASSRALESGREDIALGASRALHDAYCQLGNYTEGVRYGEAGLALAREQGAGREEAALLNGLGLALLEMKNPSAARSYFEQSLVRFRAEGDLRGIAQALSNLGAVSGYQGNYTAARDYCEQALRIARETGSRKGESILLANMGWLSGLLGDYRSAQIHTERNLQIAREIGDRYTETISLINLSAQAGATRDFGAAAELANQGLALARQSGDRNLQAWALTYLGHARFDSGALEPADEAYAEALELRRGMDQSTLATEPQAGLARIRLARGELPLAAVQVDAILNQLELDGTLEGTDQPLRVYLGCHLVLRAIDDPRARGLLNTAHDMLKTRANGIPDPLARQAFLENISVNRELLALWSAQHPGDSPSASPPRGHP